MNESDFSPEQPTSKEHSLFDCMLAFEQARSAENWSSEQMMSTSFLQAKDILIVESGDDAGLDNSFIFRVNKADWNDLNISGSWAPASSVRGLIEGAHIPAELGQKELFLMGSGEGGSSVRSSTIEKEKSLYVAEGMREYHLPWTAEYGVARESSPGKLEVLNADDLKNASEASKEAHEDALRRVVDFVKKFGFEDLDFMNSQSSTDYSYQENDSYLAECHTGKATGNELVILDKKSRQIVICKYFNYQDEDILQIAYADLSHSKETPPEKDIIRSLNISGVFRADVPIVTFNSSSALGIETVSYHPNDHEVLNDLNLPPISEDFVAGPDIQLWSNGDLKISTERYPMSVLVRKYPDIPDKLAGEIKGKWEEDGRHTLELGDKKIKIKSIEDIFAELEKLLER